MRVSVAAAAALAASYSRDAIAIEAAFQHLTAERVNALQVELGLSAPAATPLFATVLLRRLVHRILDKRSTYGDVRVALEQHRLLPALEELKSRSGGSREQMWHALMEHQMTSYVPVQCERCGHQVPDDTSPGCSDAEVGLREDTPTEEELPLVRAGWYRGPRGRVVFELSCPRCEHVSRWFRSSAACVTLRPHRWGRLCGEQEDARTALAAHLGVPLRVALPLDWDHVWSEYQRDDGATWAVHEGRGDAPAANFAQRLDEGIGTWTGVLVISPDAAHTHDATGDYLDCAPNGRAHPSLAAEMARFRDAVDVARRDATGATTQARSVNGHLVYVAAGFSTDQVTAVLRGAIADHGRRGWWEVEPAGGGM